ncbi:MAG: hypothetical protein GC157_05480 [Frankiales bacterium]|nr:hypothetical protein [Frankiales bacterium]
MPGQRSAYPGSARGGVPPRVVDVANRQPSTHVSATPCDAGPCGANIQPVCAGPVPLPHQYVQYR